MVMVVNSMSMVKSRMLPLPVQLLSHTTRIHTHTIDPIQQPLFHDARDENKSSNITARYTLEELDVFVSVAKARPARNAVRITRGTICDAHTAEARTSSSGRAVDNVHLPRITRLQSELQHATKKDNEAGHIQM